ncbi:MAG TPA: hypothetical protein VHZ95_15605 [Polyangiales bacterium]|nr:hypothetical protein [Polyangiales bacterium]
MTRDEAIALLNRHWPEFSGQAQCQLGRFIVFLSPRFPCPRQRGEWCALSLESFDGALLDLATWSTPTLRCDESTCPLCGVR